MQHELETDYKGAPTLSVVLTKHGELRLSAAFRRHFNLRPGDPFIWREKDETGLFTVDHWPSHGRPNRLAEYRESREQMKQDDAKIEPRPFDYYDRLIPTKAR